MCVSLEIMLNHQQGKGLHANQTGLRQKGLPTGAHLFINARAHDDQFDRPLSRRDNLLKRVCTFLSLYAYHLLRRI